MVTATTADPFARLGATIATMANLGPGWRLERTVHGLPPLVIAELRQYDDQDRPVGEPAYWLLDQDGRLVGNTLEALSAPLAARVVDALLWLIAGRDDDPGGALTDLATALRGLDRPFRLALMAHLFADAACGPLDAFGLGADDAGRLTILDTDGAASLTIDGGLEFPLSAGGRVTGFLPGWRAVAVVTCFAPLLMVELLHKQGTRATWVLDGWLRRVDDENFSDPGTIAVLRRIAPAMIRRHWRQLVALQDCRPDHRPLPMLRLNQGALHRLFHRVRDLVVPHTEDLTLRGLDQPLVLPPAPGRPAPLVLPEAQVRRTVRHRPYDAGLQAIRSGALTWPSPVDGSDAALEAVFVPQEQTVIYQFADRNGLRFLIATGERDCQVIGLYLPLDHRFVGDAEPPNWWFRGHIPADFWAMLYEHCVCHAETIHGRRRAGAIEIVNVFMALPLLHIGHYVWNDLTGQAALLRDLGARAPRSLILGAPRGQAEFFGPLERLFPPLAGRIDRSLPGVPALVDQVYAGTMVPIRFTGSRIDLALRETVAHAVRSGEAYAAVLRERAELGAQLGPGPVIIAGLRLDDRTFVDPEAFYAGLLDHLDRTRPGAILVLDGRNAKPGGAAGEVIASIKDHLASRAPLEAERDLVERLRAHAAGRRVGIVSTVGLPVEASMGWCYQAALCVSPWGAGLAKYRWLANLPSVILTSRHNLLHRADLDIYHAPRWMEDPSPLLLPDPDRVVDRPDRHGLAPNREPHGRECFEVDPAHVWRLVDTLLPDRA